MRETLLHGLDGLAAGVEYGKTVFINEFLYRGITLYSANGVFVTFEEKPEAIMKNVASFGWDYPSLVKQKKLAFVDASPEYISEISPDYDMSALIERIRFAVRETGAKRLVLDSISAVLSRFTNESVVRSAIWSICDELSFMGITTLITVETKGEESASSKFGVEEFVADGVIHLAMELGQQQIIRTISIKKMRGVGYRSGRVEFDITSRGFEIYPKIPVDVTMAKTNYKVRKKTGVRGLDKALHGGIPQGHIVLLSGNTGTGKSLLGIQFLVEGIRKKENGVFVTLEEPIEQVEKSALRHGWNLEEYSRKKKLFSVQTGLLDIKTDRLLLSIIEAIEKVNAKRLFIDSISSLLSATLNPEQVRQMLYQLTRFLKSRGITCMMSYLNNENFGAVKGQLLSGLSASELRMSSLVDGLILLLYVERNQTVKKLLNVLKMRGIEHSKDIMKYEIRKGGFAVVESYKK